MSMSRDEIRALLDEVATTPEQTAKDEAHRWAEEAVEEEIIDGLSDDANHNARLDITERMGATPDLPSNHEQYVDIFVKAFAIEFERLYRSAYKHHYRKSYRKHFKAEQQLAVV